MAFVSMAIVSVAHVEVSRGAAVQSSVGFRLRLPRLAALAALATYCLVVVLLEVVLVLA